MPRPLSDTTFVVTDVETTGLSPQKHRVTEVACVVVRDGGIVDRRRTLVNPEQFIPHRIQEMTGITNAMALTAPKGPDIFPEIRDWFVADSAFVAHNVTFDFNFLQESFRRYGLSSIGHPKLCTVRLARRLLADRRGWSLDNLVAHFGVKVNGRHTALGDAEATARVLIEFLDLLQEEHGCETLEDLLSFQYRTLGTFREVPKHIRALEPTLSALPSAPGVYTMFSRHGEVLYVGKAKSLRDRVGSYFRAGAEHTPKIAEMVHRVRRLEYEATGSELAALLLESRRIKELQPRYNTLQKRFRRYAFLRLTSTEAFPRVELALEVEPDGAEYFGPFNGRDSVEMVIDAVNRTFGLRECAEQIVPSESFTPCFYHQIKRCGAPCSGLQSHDAYLHEVEEVRAFLSGSEEGIIARMERRMMEHADRLEFEDAAALRNRIAELRRIFTRQQRIAESINANNVLLLLPSAVPGRKELFLIRYGRLIRHLVIGRRFPEKTIRRLVEQIYFDGAGVPPHFRKPEIDEVRIIAGYLYQRRDERQFVYIGAGDSVESAMAKIAEEWRRVGP